MGGNRLLLAGKNLVLLGQRFASHQRRHERTPVQGRLKGSIVHEDGRTTLECSFILRSRHAGDGGLYRHSLQVMSDAKDRWALAQLEEFVRRPQLSEAA